MSQRRKPQEKPGNASSDPAPSTVSQSLQNAETVEYPLSPVQTKHAAIHESRVKAAEEAFELAEAKYQASRDLLNAARRQRNEFLAYIVQEFELPETTEGYGLETSQGVFRLVGRRVPPPADPPNSDTNNE